VGIHVACMVILFDFCVFNSTCKEIIRETVLSALLKRTQG